MDLKEIEVFLKVMEYKKLTAAADSLGMTQPAVSNILKRMEQELGSPLFIRRGKTLLPSVQGQIFYESARNQQFMIQRAISGVNQGLTDKREVIVATLVSSDWFLQVAGSFSAEHPDTRLVFQSEKHVPQNHRLSAAEFLLLPACGVQDEQTLAVDYQNGLYAILQQDHPLAQEKALSLHRLREEDFVFVRREGGEYEQCYWDCFYAGFLPHISLAVNTKVAKYAAIRCGCGIGLVYDSELALAADMRDCVVVPIRGNTSGGTIYLAWYDSCLTEPGRAFLTYVRGKIAE